VKKIKRRGSIDMVDPNSRDYKPDEIDEDPRFKRASYEALFVQIFFTVAILIVGAVAYLTGGGDPAGMHFFFGWPMWYIAGFLAAIVFIVIGLIWLYTKFGSDSLEARVEYRKEGK